MTGSAEIAHLFNAAWDAVAAREPTPPGVIAQPKRARVEGALAAPAPNPLPVLAHLDRAIEAARAGPLGPLADAFAATVDQLSWSQAGAYLSDPRARRFLEGYGFAIVSGPDGPVRRDTPLSGFILLAPGHHYPAHHHPPREIYLPLTPGARWRLGEGAWFDVPAGQLIYHDAWVVHATMTGHEPFLAFVAWLDPAGRTSVRWAEDPLRATPPPASP